MQPRGAKGRFISCRFLEGSHLASWPRVRATWPGPTPARAHHVGPRVQGRSDRGGAAGLRGPAQAGRTSLAHADGGRSKSKIARKSHQPEHQAKPGLGGAPTRPAWVTRRGRSGSGKHRGERPRAACPGCCGRLSGCLATSGAHPGWSTPWTRQRPSCWPGSRVGSRRLTNAEVGQSVKWRCVRDPPRLARYDSCCGGTRRP